MDGQVLILSLAAWNGREYHGPRRGFARCLGRNRHFPSLTRPLCGALADWRVRRSEIPLLEAGGGFQCRRGAAGTVSLSPDRAALGAAGTAKSSEHLLTSRLPPLRKGAKSHKSSKHSSIPRVWRFQAGPGGTPIHGAGGDLGGWRCRKAPNASRIWEGALPGPEAGTSRIGECFEDSRWLVVFGRPGRPENDERYEDP